MALFQKLHTLDERSILHRYKATRWSLISGLLVMFSLILNDQFTHDLFRMDLFVIIMVMTIVKVIARVVYSKVN